MGAINRRELASMYAKGPQRAMEHLTESLEQKELHPTDFRIRDVAEAVMGREWVENLQPKSGRLYRKEVLEDDAVKYTHFSHITGQIFFSMVKEAYEAEEFVFSQTIPTKTSNIQDMEKVPGISGIGDDFTVVGEGDPYPVSGVSEDYIEIAAKQKRGRIVPVTKEAVLGDLTGMLLENCRQVGYFLGLNKEKRLIDAVIDENGGAKSAALGGHRYHWRGTSYATYQTTTPWVNVKTSNGLTDYTDVQAAWELFADLTDPFTGEPILVQPDTVIVQPGNEWVASRILNSTEIRTNTNNSAGTGDVEMITGNPVNVVIGTMRLLTSRLLKARSATDTDWWIGNPGKAFVYMANWEILPEEAPANNHMAFERDILHQFKASEKGVAGTLEPRLMVENRA